MRGTARALLIALTLVLWVVSGPVAMSFDGCAMMGAMCEAPCGVLSYIVAPSPVGAVVLPPLMYLTARPAERLAGASPNPLDPPPKSALLPA